MTKTEQRWTIIGDVFTKPVGKSTKKAALCRCRCGTERVIVIASIKAGHTRSCGCYDREVCVARSTRHNAARRGKETREYKAWKNMIMRCTNPKSTGYENYGGRGITVWADWLCRQGQGFTGFVLALGPCPSENHSLERKDVNGDYSPDNCVWATVDEQANNKRGSVYLSHNGRTMTLKQWATHLGLSANALYQRRYLGWDDTKILTTPIRQPKIRKPAPEAT